MAEAQKPPIIVEVPKKAGSTPCPRCKTTYKNNAVPPVCLTGGCGFPLGKKCSLTLGSLRVLRHTLVESKR